MKEKEILEEIKKFVEGKTTIEEFEVFAKTNQDFRNYIKDYNDGQIDRVYNTTLELIDNTRYDYIREIGILWNMFHWMLARKKIEAKRDFTIYDKRVSFCDKYYPSSLPSNALRILDRYINKKMPHGLSEEKQGEWINKIAKAMFKSKGKAPEWVQGTEDWPMDKNGKPMVFVKQKDKDEYSTYVFESEDGKEKVTIEELF